MITESHMKKHHSISCREYSRKFNLQKGQLNPHHSKNMSGSGNPRYGATISIETREKIRNIHKTKGTFKGKKNPMYGKTHTLEVREFIRKINKIKMKGEGNSFYGRKHSKETKIRISKIRIKLGLAKGKNNPLYGIGHTKETRRKQSVIRKEFNLKYPEKNANVIMAKNYKNQKNKKGGYISKGQIRVYEALKKKFSDAILNHPIKTGDTVYFGDVGIPSLNLIIEYDGAYWHDVERDKIRDKKIQGVGWRVIRFKDREVDKREDLLGYILSRIEEV